MHAEVLYHASFWQLIQHGSAQPRVCRAPCTHHVILTRGCPRQVVAYPWKKPFNLRSAISSEGFHHPRCHADVWWPRQVVAYPWEKLSDLRQAIYPEGFYNVRGPSALHWDFLGKE